MILKRTPAVNTTLVCREGNEMVPSRSQIVRGRAALEQCACAVCVGCLHYFYVAVSVRAGLRRPGGQNGSYTQGDSRPSSRRQAWHCMQGTLWPSELPLPLGLWDPGPNTYCPGCPGASQVNRGSGLGSVQLCWLAPTPEDTLPTMWAACDRIPGSNSNTI